MKRTAILLFWGMYCLSLSAQNQISLSQYWFDGDFLNVQTDSSFIHSSTYTFDDSISTQSLGAGIHTFHIRFRDDSSRYSPVLTRYFIKATLQDGDSIVSCEYWFNDDYNNKVQVQASPGSVYLLDSNLNVDQLQDGIHLIHLRFKDDAGRYSAVLSRYFIKSPPASAKNFVSFEYWFNDDYGSKSQTAVTPGPVILLDSNLDVSSLRDGVHILHIRFRDDGGQYNAVLSRYFIKRASSNAQNISSLEYWFNDDYDNRSQFAVTPGPVILLDSNLDVSGLRDGVHILHLRFKDDEGKYNPVLSRYFIKPSSSTAQNITELYASGHLHIL